MVGKFYDFQEETLVFAAPGQVIGNDDTGEPFQPKGWWLTFQPELLHGTPLNRHMQDYTFFSYAVNEALHLSKQERQTVIDCMMKIDDEIKGATDRHSNLIVVSAIELLLNYCIRFYDRQFITRKKENKDTLSSFEALLNDYFTSDKPSKFGTPTVAYCADQLHLSANYFGDLIKRRQVHLHKNIYWQKQWILQKSGWQIRINRSVMLPMLWAINTRSISAKPLKELSDVLRMNTEP